MQTKEKAKTLTIEEVNAQKEALFDELTAHGYSREYLESVYLSQKIDFKNKLEKLV